MTLTTVPDIPDGLTPTAARIYTALHAAPGSTVADLARTANAGKSTTANLLKQMERDGVACRTLGGSDGNRRFPDHWYTSASTPEAGRTPDVPDQHGEGTNPAGTEDPEADASGMSAAARTGQRLLPDEVLNAPSPARMSAAEPQFPPDDDTSAEALPHGRLGQGGLRSLVHAFLAEYPDAAHSPTKVSRHLGRSSGAVANALVTLVNLGQVEMVTAKPRTYRIAESPTRTE